MDDDVAGGLFLIFILWFIFWEADGGIFSFSKEMTLHYTSEKCVDVENLEACGKREYLKTTFKVSEERQQVIGLHQDLENTEIQEVCIKELYEGNTCLSGKPFMLQACIVMNRDNWHCQDFTFPGFGLIGVKDGDWITSEDGGWVTYTVENIKIEAVNWKIIWWWERFNNWIDN